MQIKSAITNESILFFVVHALHDKLAYLASLPKLSWLKNAIITLKRILNFEEGGFFFGMRASGIQLREGNKKFGSLFVRSERMFHLDESP